MPDEPRDLVAEISDLAVEVAALVAERDAMLGDMREVHAKLFVGGVEAARAQLDAWTGLEEE